MPQPSSRRPKPAPLDANPGEPPSHLRTRAMLWADWHGWVTHLWPVDPENVKPSEQRHAFLPPGVELADLDGDPPTVPAHGVLWFVAGLALAHGDRDMFDMIRKLAG